jgi:ubiquinone biosynthesis protein
VIFARFRLFFSQLFRFVEILAVVVRHLVADFLGRSRVGRFIVPAKKRRQIQAYTTPNRIRMVLEELGPTFIKFGQIMADRPDLVSELIRKDLKFLQDRAIPLPDHQALDLIHKELHAPIEDIFETLDSTYLASASIGQVYKGRLKSGESVIVKIQRPGIEAKIKLDLLLLGILARRFQKRYPDLVALDLPELVTEFGTTLLAELNYLNEAANLNRFREMFRDNPNVHIPMVYADYCTRKMLVMEFVSGLRPDKPEELREHQLSPEAVAANGAQAVCEMIFTHGFFHADPHAGNIFILPGNVVCFIDFGIVGILKPAHMHFLASFALGLAKWDAKALTKALVELCGKKFFAEQEDLEFEIEKILKKFSYTPSGRIDFSQVLNECITVIAKYNLKIPGSMYLLAKALASMQKFAFNLDPDLNIAAVLEPFAKKLLMKRFSLRRMAGELFDTLQDYVALVRDLPSEINEILYKVKEGKLQLDINFNQSEKAGSWVQRFSRGFSMYLLLFVLLLSITLYAIWGTNKDMGENYMVILQILTALVLLKLFFRGK